MMHIQQEQDGEKGTISSFRWCRDASYVFQLILVKGNILAYFSFLEKNSPVKRVFSFNLVDWWNNTSEVLGNQLKPCVMLCTLVWIVHLAPGHKVFGCYLHQQDITGGTFMLMSAASCR